MLRFYSFRREKSNPQQNAVCTANAAPRLLFYDMQYTASIRAKRFDFSRVEFFPFRTREPNRRGLWNLKGENWSEIIVISFSFRKQWVVELSHTREFMKKYAERYGKKTHKIKQTERAINCFCNGCFCSLFSTIFLRLIVFATIWFAYLRMHRSTSANCSI